MIKIDTKLGWSLDLTDDQYKSYRRIIVARGLMPVSAASDGQWLPNLIEERDRSCPGTACVERWFADHPGEESVLILTPMGVELSGEHKRHPC